MKIVAAIDSFKGSMTSIDAGDAVALGIQRACPTAEVVVRPLADGGEGTVEALIEGMQGQRQVVTVMGPLEKPVDCVYGIIPKTNTAVIEMSGAAGVTLVERSELNPLLATTYGVGEVLRDAINKGCRRFIVGIGGSATNDGGVGMLQALGFDFLDEDCNPIEKGAKGLRNLAKISTEHVMPELKECEFMVACDVINPLLGENGCSAVFGPQKGATEEMVQEMDQLLSHYAKLAKECLMCDVDPEYPGSGAAGGVGFACRTFLNATLKSGIDIVLEETHLEEYIKSADFVITGEGMLDFQTAMGKAPVGVAKLAKKYGKPVIAFAGGVTKDANACNNAGIDAFFPIVRGITTLEDAMKIENAKENLSDTAEQVMRVIGCSKE